MPGVLLGPIGTKELGKLGRTTSLVQPVAAEPGMLDIGSTTSGLITKAFSG